MSTTEETLTAEAIDGLAAMVRGRVLRPGDADYDTARAVWNGLIDRRPAVIVQCSGTADVIEAVNFAREEDLRRLDPRRRAQRCRERRERRRNRHRPLADAGRPRRRRGAAPRSCRAARRGATSTARRSSSAWPCPAASSRRRASAGLTLHGGMGHLRRKHGLSIDNLISADVVTADGQLRRASATENEDLYWAIRGAGSNFGVVTSFEFAAHPVGPTVYVGAIFYPLEEAPRAARRWRDFMADAPEEVSSLAICWSVPAGPPFPEEHPRARRPRDRGGLQRHARGGRADHPAAARARPSR